MIGNDIIDLQLAQVQSNWRRPNFLAKIFTKVEQNFISRAHNPGLEVWKLWSRKEAAYKMYNRETGIRGYFPWKIECSMEENFSTENIGFVSINNKEYVTETYSTEDYVYSIAVNSINLLPNITEVNQAEKIIKINDLPFLANNLKPVSITHHGRFERKITLLDW